VLGDFVRKYDKQVAPVTSSVWGWSQYNDVGNSNHLAGTAVDINAPQWPWGIRTMGSDMILRINRLLEDYRVGSEYGVYWGRNWSRPDEMHFQLNWKEGDGKWSILLAKIQGGASTIVVPDNSYVPTLVYGSSGAAVTHLQAGMNAVFSGYPTMPLVVDGDFGPNTKAAVIEFQGRVGLEKDGIVGPLTWAELAKFHIKP
jgi:peptidoglycan hydrolase-like protein with peptidoglycan-binding domain